MTGRHLEDFAAGPTFGSGRLRAEPARVKTFAAAFDLYEAGSLRLGASTDPLRARTGAA